MIGFQLLQEENGGNEVVNMHMRKLYPISYEHLKNKTITSKPS
jgi:hypothetical protein